MEERTISLRPHHIDRFVGYYHDFRHVFDNPETIQRYGEKFTKKLKSLFDYIASGGTTKDYILVRNGLDSICNMCPIKKKTCLESDSLSIWNGSGEVMRRTGLREGWLYPLAEFLEKVKQAYPDRNPKKGRISN